MTLLEKLTLENANTLKYIIIDNVSQTITLTWNKSDYAYNIMEELGYLDDLPSIISAHIDYDGVIRDLEISGDISIIYNENEIELYNNDFDYEDWTIRTLD